MALLSDDKSVRREVWTSHVEGRRDTSEGSPGVRLAGHDDLLQHFPAVSRGNFEGLAL